MSPCSTLRLNLRMPAQPWDIGCSDFTRWVRDGVDVGELLSGRPAQGDCAQLGLHQSDHRGSATGSPTAIPATGEGPHGDTIDDIAVAMELKFLIPTQPAPIKHTESPSRFDSKSSTEANGVQQVYKNISHTIVDSAGQPSLTCFDVAGNNAQERDYWDTHWIVKKANSAQPEGDAKRFPQRQLVPVELSSHKYRWTSGDAPRSISAILEALGKAHSLVTNYTCDVHVHVGRMDGRPFSLSTLKRLAILLWLTEDCLRSIRDPRSPNYHNVYTWGAEIRKHSRLARRLGGEQPEHTRDNEGLHGWVADLLDGHAADLSNARARECAALNLIWDAASHLELGRLLSGVSKQYRRLGFNFSAFGEEDDRARNGPKTLEFRILEGTLQQDAVLGWMEMCCNLVKVAVAWPRDRYLDFVGGIVRNELIPEDSRGRQPREVDNDVQQDRLRRLADCLGVNSDTTEAFLKAINEGRERRND